MKKGKKWLVLQSPVVNQNVMSFFLTVMLLLDYTRIQGREIGRESSTAYLREGEKSSKRGDKLFPSLSNEKKKRPSLSLSLSDFVIPRFFLVAFIFIDVVCIAAQVIFGAMSSISYREKKKESWRKRKDKTKKGGVFFSFSSSEKKRLLDIPPFFLLLHFL